jgi:perosamine synthetase
MSDNLKYMTISPSSSIKNAMISIDKNATSSIFITQKKKILGIVTDGDIRRHLIKNRSIKIQIKFLMNKNFISINSFETKSNIFKITEKFKHKIRVFPVINKNKELVDFIFDKKIHKIPIYKPTLEGNEKKYLLECVSDNWISSGGYFVLKFEKRFSQIHSGIKSLAVTSGTTAIHLALVSLGIGKGDEVIVPNLTFAAVINAVLYTGAKPIIVDVDRHKWTIDCNEIEKNISKKTKAIIPVHIFGNPCPIEKIMKIAKKNKIFVIEDCAEAIGSTYKKKKVGITADCAIFSFFGNKTITTGEGGMILFKDDKVYSIAKKLRDHGMSEKKKYYHDEIGYNYRMTNMQAAIGLAQLERLNEIVKKKLYIAKTYKKILYKNVNLDFQKDEKNSLNSFWAIALLIKNNKFNYKTCEEELNNRGIEIRNFFYPLNEQKIYKKFANKKTYVTDNFVKKGILLPTFPSLSLSNIKYICKNIEKYLDSLDS